MSDHFFGELQEDPFTCDISGVLISMDTDGRYHFNDGSQPEDPAAVIMVRHHVLRHDI